MGWFVLSWFLTGAALALGYALGRGASRAREAELEAVVAWLHRTRDQADAAAPGETLLRSARRRRAAPRAALDAS